MFDSALCLIVLDSWISRFVIYVYCFTVAWLWLLACLSILVVYWFRVVFNSVAYLQFCFVLLVFGCLF